MKKILIIAVLLGLAWSQFSKEGAMSELLRDSTDRSVGKMQVQNEPLAASFHCDGRQHCSQMQSRAEAEFFIKNCPDTKMDGDHDGIPCENDSRF